MSTKMPSGLPIHYARIALRALLKRKSYTLLTIVGMALAMAVCLIIVLVIEHELSYDRFHRQHQNIHRVAIHSVLDGKEKYGSRTPGPFADALVGNVAGVEAATRVYYSDVGAKTLVSRTTATDKQFFEERFLYADSSFFHVFSFPLLSGNADKILHEPYTVLLTEETARKYFGTENPLGQTLRIGGERDYRIVGILQNIPTTSHIKFDFLASYNSLSQWEDLQKWLGAMVYSYVRLKPDAAKAAVEGNITAFMDKQVGSMRRKGVRVDYPLQPITDIHLHSKHIEFFQPQSDIQYIWIFALIGVFILTLACINFVNLVTAHSADRAREVGVRKTFGAQRKQLIAQFLVESLALALCALLVALLLVEIGLPFVRTLLGIPLQTVISWQRVVVLLFAWLGIGIIAGFYPALVLTQSLPSAALRVAGRTTTGGARSLLRSSLVVFQFVVSVVLIVGTIILYQQLSFLRATNLGFAPEQVVYFHMNNVFSAEQQELFKDALRRNPNIVEAASGLAIPGQALSMPSYRYVMEASADGPHTLQTLFVDETYIPTLGLEIVQGRNFSKQFPTDRTESFIINETAAKFLGWKNPIGKDFDWHVPTGAKGMVSWKKGRIVGVVKDFHSNSLHQAMKLLVLHIYPEWSEYFFVKIKPGNAQETIAFMNQEFQKFRPGQAIDYAFLNQSFAKLYRSEENLAALTSSFAILGLIIACLGLFGLATFMAERRTKEIGVRKVLGASETSIMALLSKDFALLVAIAIVIACPLAWWGMNTWLRNFAYHVEIRLWVFVVAGLIALAIALFTVSYQAFKAARINPVQALRSE
ncbi:MAG: ABC transporter permease [Ignavibacteria bacterium]|nr:ABC transporter permease [Ignavibacteria bacterium]